jgi:hypothetical protein
MFKNIFILLIIVIHVMEKYNKLSAEKLQCPYCSKPVNLFNINRHMKTKSCLKWKERYFDVHKDKNENEFNLYVNELRQKIIHPELNE